MGRPGAGAGPHLAARCALLQSTAAAAAYAGWPGTEAAAWIDQPGQALDRIVQAPCELLLLPRCPAGHIVCAALYTERQLLLVPRQLGCLLGPIIPCDLHAPICPHLLFHLCCTALRSPGNLFLLCHSLSHTCSRCSVALQSSWELTLENRVSNKKIGAVLSTGAGQRMREGWQKRQECEMLFSAAGAASWVCRNEAMQARRRKAKAWHGWAAQPGSGTSCFRTRPPVPGFKRWARSSVVLRAEEEVEACQRGSRRHASGQEGAAIHLAAALAAALRLHALVACIHGLGVVAAGAGIGLEAAFGGGAHGAAVAGWQLLKGALTAVINVLQRAGGAQCNAAGWGRSVMGRTVGGVRSVTSAGGTMHVPPGHTSRPWLAEPATDMQDPLQVLQTRPPALHAAHSPGRTPAHGLRSIAPRSPRKCMPSAAWQRAQRRPVGRGQQHGVPAAQAEPA